MALYKRADQPQVDHPKPYDDFQGWESTEDNVLEPIWACGPILPPSLVDLLEATIQEVENHNDQDDVEIEYNDIFEDGD